MTERGSGHESSAGRAPIASRRLLTAYSTRARLEAARVQIAATDPAEGLLVVGPNQRAADDIVRGAGRGTLGVVRTTLMRLATETTSLAMAGRGLAMLSGLASVALAHRAAARARARQPLAHLEPVADHPGFGRAVAETLSRLRTERIRPASLADIRPSGPDLARILEAYEAVREEAGLLDEAALYDLAREVGVTPASRNGLFVDVAPRHAAEKAFLSELVPRLENVTVLLAHPDEEGRHAWETIVGTPATPLSTAGDEAETPLARARRFLFSRDEPKDPDDDRPTEDPATPLSTAGPPAAPDAPRPLLFSAAGEGPECVQIARRILALAARGTRFDRIAVLIRNPVRTQPLLEDALDRARIPFFCSRGARRPHPTGRAFLSLLSCALDGLSASRFAEYLSLDGFPRVENAADLAHRPHAWAPPKDERQLVFVSETHTAPPVERSPDAPEPPVHFPLAWERHLNDAAVIGGRARWERRLAGYRAELCRRLEIVAVEDEPRAGYFRREIESLEHLRTLALPIIDRLARFPERASWSEWLDHLGALAGMALREPEPVAEILTELSVMGPVRAVSLIEVERVLASRLRDLRDEPEGARFGRVFVGTLEDAAARSFEVVFVPGLAEGLFPRRIFEDPLLLDKTAEGLSPALVRRSRLVRGERLLLHGALAAAERQVVLSCPRIDALRGRARVPSFYALEVMDAAGGRRTDPGPLAHWTEPEGAGALGWPAPAEPDEAVDEAEYDLATLGPLLRMNADRARGRARYLVVDAQGGRQSTPLVRALETSWNRGRTLWTEADGLLTQKKPVRRRLADFAPSRRTYSPTALQRYAACPYRFFLGSILRLAPREVPARIDQLDPLTRGSLFHAVQFAAFGALCARGLWPVNEDNVEAGHAALRTAFEAVADRWAEDLAPALPGVWHRELEGLWLDLGRWLQAGGREPAWRAVRSELAFGLDPAQAGERDPDSRSRAIRIMDRYRIRGSIDWVERHEGTGHLRVTDHKTGRPPPRRPVYVGGGEHLQPVLYGLAVRSMLAEPVDEGRLYYCTERGGFEVVAVPLDAAAEDRVAAVFETIDTAVRDGTLVAAPAPGKCKWCDYRAVCGPNAEARATAKHPSLLDALRVLRDTP